MLSDTIRVLKQACAAEPRLTPAPPCQPLLLVPSPSCSHVNPEDCEIFHHAVACGLISGDGIWTIPEAILALAGVQPPLCMGWTSSL